MSYEDQQKRLLALWEEVDSDLDPVIDSDSDKEEDSEMPVYNQHGEHEDLQDEIEVIEENVTDAEDHLESEENFCEGGRQSQFFLSKDATKWAKQRRPRNVRTRAENIIIHLPGVRGAAKEKKSVLECWQLFFTDEMLTDIVRYTNSKIETKCANYNSDHQYLVKPTLIHEIKALFGLLYLTGLYKSGRQNIGDLWNTDGSGIDLFRTTMSLKRVYFLLQCLRFDNIETRAQRKEIDKLAPIRGIYERFNEYCKIHYSPSEYLTIDEKLEPFRGRVSFLQYIPNKPAKYGIKVFALVDAKTFYCLNMEVYVGTQPEGPFRKSNKPDDLVERLIQPVSGTNRNITFDNWFTSYPLMLNLLKTHKLTSVGTVRKNKRQIPKAFLNIRNREPRSSLFAFQEEITAVSYVPKKSKNVILFSTLHHDDVIIEQTGEKQLPEIINFYNANKCGVDVLDELSANYTVARNSRRWPLTLFFSFLNSAGVNSQVIYKANTKQYNMKRRLYLKELGIQLITEFRNERLSNPRLPRELRPKTSAAPSSSKRQKTSTRCSFCPRNKDRKTFYCCSNCSSPICLEHANFRCEDCTQLEKP